LTPTMSVQFLTAKVPDRITREDIFEILSVGEV
jgi:hypothetical protein